MYISFIINNNYMYMINYFEKRRKKSYIIIIIITLINQLSCLSIASRVNVLGSLFRRINVRGNKRSQSTLDVELVTDVTNDFISTRELTNPYES